MTLSSVPKVVVRSVGEVHADDRGYAVEEISSVIAEGSEPMSDTGVKISLLTLPGLARPAVAQAQGVIKRGPLRAQVAAPTVREAVDGVVWRIGRQLARPPLPRLWKVSSCGSAPEIVPMARRNIARAKAFHLEQCTPRQAALAMDRLDFNFHLFVDAETGEDSLVRRAGPTGYRLTRLNAMRPPAESPDPFTITIDVHKVPTAAPLEIAKLLGETEMGYRFFRDATTARGNVVYRRYDGHFGLLAPAEG